MYNFEYVTKNQAKPVKKELCEIIYEVQDIVRPYFTFQYQFVGSSKYNMITVDKKSNKGFDFDINIVVNHEDYQAYEIRKIIKNAIDKVAHYYGYKYCEDSTSVLTIKKVDRYNSRILYSCDFALVYNCDNGKYQYIKFNKSSNTYTREYRGGGFKNLEKKIKWLKANNHWGELKQYYLNKKNYNNNPNKHSRSLFAESINEMYQRKRS